MCPVHPTFHSQTVLKNTFLGTIMTYIYNTFFNTITKRLYLHRHVRLTGIRKACFGQSSKQGDWFASSYDPKWGRKRNIHIPWTISTVQCFSFSSTVGFVLVDNWVEFAIFYLAGSITEPLVGPYDFSPTGLWAVRSYCMESTIEVHHNCSQHISWGRPSTWACPSVLKDMALQQADNFRLYMLSAHGNVCVNKL